ncbi:hypothetical protein [Nocardioides caricicola]|uniref:NERD domain-containing protein n=1 Tax=Nocardioides caricicola TaxID=634770 RepID=A0ABW0N1V4_9ACTN
MSDPYSSAFRWWLLGAIQAATVVALIAMLSVGFLVHDRDAILQLRGAWGEENTRDELARAKRRHLIWGWVDSIPLQIGDMDHFVVTRRGGLVVVDSKWRSAAVTDADDMARAARRVRTRAEGVVRSCIARDRAGKHRGKVNPLAVRPVVVLWGPAQYDLQPGYIVDGVEFVAGRRLFEWLKALDSGRTDREAATQLLQQLSAFRAQVRRETVAR